MAWDKTLPSNSTKIRNYPQVLTDNFAAIEEGVISLKHWQINMIERNAVPGPIANDPTRADNTMIIFSKQDGSGETEAFIMDDRDPANIIQLTEDGKMGSSSTDAIFNSINLGGMSTDFDKDSFVSAWGVIDSSGNLVYGKNLAATHTRPGTGNYNVTTTAIFQSANVAIQLTALTSGFSPTVGMLDGAIGIAANVVTIPVQFENRNGNNVDVGFHVAIFGGL